MKFNRLIGLLVIFVLIVPMVSAGSAESGNNETTLALLQANESTICGYYAITQGETGFHSYSVSTGTSVLLVDLDWFTPIYSLRLNVFRPDGSLYGSYHDGDDGRAPDGWIRCEIPNPVPGAWKLQVYGERVTGTQPYALNYF